jgi:hypothetical protein
VPELTVRQRFAARISRSSVFRWALGPKVTDRDLRVFALERG